jgi:RNA-binding protein
MSPIVRVGRGGVSDAVVEETKKSLSSHELIKVRVEADDSAARKELAAKLASATGSQVAGMIGKTLILYREREENPDIELP